MDCPFCKYPIEAGTSFCSECGRELPSIALPADSPDASIHRDDSTLVHGSDLSVTSDSGVSELPDMGLPPIPSADIPMTPSPKLPPLPNVSLNTPQPPDKFDDGNPFSIELDTMLSLQEKVANTLRILFTPLPTVGRFRDVSISVSSDAGWFTSRTKQRKIIEGPYEFLFLEEDLKAATSCPCDISVSYVLAGRRHFYDGSFDIAVLNEMACRSAAQITLQNIYNVDVDATEASRVRVEIPDSAKQEVEEASKSKEHDPLKVAEGLVNLGVRKYRKISMSRSDDVDVLQKPPQEAICKEIQLDFGYGFGKIQLFTDPIVGIGHTYDGNRYTDVIIDPPCDLDETRRVPYEKMSRGQCLLQSNGSEVEIVDGRYRSSGVLSASTNGTYLNGEKIGTCGRMVLKDGRIGLGTTSRETTLDVELVTPGADSCRHCRLGGESREFCCRSGCASANVVLRRRDGVAIVYVALWSCIDIGTIYKSFSGLEIFYDNHAFAWRRGTKRGWIVPGGKIELSHFRPIVVSTVWNETNKPHSKNQSVTKKGDTER